MALALEDIRVIDLSQVLAGPGTAMYLADQGAQVIKVEPPGGEQNRHMGRSKSFFVLNRNKRSIVVDITRAEGREILYRLVRVSDVLIHNMRPGVAERLGLGYQTLAQLNPRLIYAHLTAFGEEGPYADKPGYDRIVQGLSGIMAARRLPDGTPMLTPFWVGDCSVPMLLSYGIMLALWHRQKTGRGQEVTTSLLQAAIAMQSTLMVVGEQEGTTGSEAQAAYHTYRTADGSYLNICILNEKEWRNLCQALEIEHLSAAPRFDSVGKRQEHLEELYPLLEGIFSTRTAQEWLPILFAGGVPAGPIITREQVFVEPQVVLNQMIAGVDQPGEGRLKMMAVPVRLSETPGQIRRPAPAVGEHTPEVLQELGYTEAEIEALKAAGVI